LILKKILPFSYNNFKKKEIKLTKNEAELEKRGLMSVMTKFVARRFYLI